jgi:Icc protein
MYTEETIQRIDHPGGTVQVLQLTDTHLRREAGGTLLGMDTDHSLQAVIELARRERPGVDLLLATGDLSDGGAEPAYQRLQGYLAEFDCANFWLPGNHDERSSMEAATAGSNRLSREVRVADWQVLLLDSQVAGEVGGRLGEDELSFLESSLESAAAGGLHSLVCLHHHPVEIGCEWLDEQIVTDADAFFSVLEGFPGAKGVLWGHVHQQIDREFLGLRLMGSPSTCVQFAPGSPGFKADDLPPGYRWLELHPDGRIDTGISRVWDVDFEVDLDSGGYL